MDALIAAAARLLAEGDILAALQRVALRDDPPALALRGIAMAQLGDFPRAKALLRRAARAFGPGEAVARARCVVAEAEIALVARDLGGPVKTLEAARATLETQGDRINAAYARHLQLRRLLLIGRLDEAERALAGLDPASVPPALRAARELIVAGIAMRRLRSAPARAALERACRAAREAGHPALIAEVENACRILDAPAARRTGSSLWLRSKRSWPPERWSSTPAAMSCAAPASPCRWRGDRCCSRWPARSAKHGPARGREKRSSSGRSGQKRPIRRIAPACASKSGGCGRSFAGLPPLTRHLAGLPCNRTGRTRSWFWRRPSKSGIRRSSHCSAMGSCGRVRLWRWPWGPARGPCSGRSMRLPSPAGCNPAVAGEPGDG